VRAVSLVLITALVLVSPTNVSAATETDAAIRLLSEPVPRPASIIPVGSDLADIAVDPVRPQAYVADRQNDRVLVLDLNSATLTAEIAVQNEPVALAIAPSATALYVGHAGSQAISEVDLETLAVVRTHAVPFLTWSLVAPSDGQLIATTHDVGYTGEYPYVLNAFRIQVGLKAVLAV